MVRLPPLTGPLSGFLNLSAVYATHDFTALFHAAYAHGFSAFGVLPCEELSLLSDSLLPCRFDRLDDSRNLKAFSCRLSNPRRFRLRPLLNARVIVTSYPRRHYF